MTQLECRTDHDMVPPPVIDSARLLAFAVVPDDTAYAAGICLLVDGVRVGRVPGLAICRNYCKPDEVLLFFCDGQWCTQGCIPVSRVEEAKLQAARDYPELLQHWRDSPYCDEQVASFLRTEYGVDPATEWWRFRCSFCQAECEGMAISKGWATICRACIEEFHALLGELE